MTLSIQITKLIPNESRFAKFNITRYMVVSVLLLDNSCHSYNDFVILHVQCTFNYRDTLKKV